MKKINLTVARLATLVAFGAVYSCGEALTDAQKADLGKIPTIETTANNANTGLQNKVDGAGAVSAVEADLKDAAKSKLKPLIGAAGFAFDNADAAGEFKPITKADAEGIKKAGAKSAEIEKLSGLGSAAEIEDFVKANASRKKLIAEVKAICTTSAAFELAMVNLGYGGYTEVNSSAGIAAAAAGGAGAEGIAASLTRNLGSVFHADEGNANGLIVKWTTSNGGGATNGIYKITSSLAGNNAKAAKLGTDGKLAAAVAIGT